MSAPANKVDLLIIGAQKSGTTSLYRYMSQHPEVVFSRVKEVTYFVDDELYAKGVDYYHSFFPPVNAGSKTVSSYVHMLSCQAAPERVRAYNPEMRFIVLLRNPVERAWSAYQYARQMGWEKGDDDFLAAFAAESQRMMSDDQRVRLDTVYGHHGLYCKHLEHWMHAFPAEQFLILRSEDLRDNVGDCLEKIWEFLDVSQTAAIDTSTEYNRAGRTRIRWLNAVMYDRSNALLRYIGRMLPARTRIWIRSRIFPWLQRINTADTRLAQIPDTVVEILSEYYADDLRKLEQEFGIRF